MTTYIKQGMVTKNIPISKYEKISILKCEYTDELGVVFQEEPKITFSDKAF